MSFSNNGLLQLAMLLVLFSQGCPQCYTPTRRSLGFVRPNCCTNPTNNTMKAVRECFEQTPQAFHHCRVHAFILRNGNKMWCVDPRAEWLQRRLQRLERRGICCQII